MAIFGKLCVKRPFQPSQKPDVAYDMNEGNISVLTVDYRTVGIVRLLGNQAAMRSAK